MTKHRVKGYSYKRGGKTIRVKSYMSKGRKSGHSLSGILAHRTPPLYSQSGRKDTPLVHPVPPGSPGRRDILPVAPVRPIPGVPWAVGWAVGVHRR